MHKIAISNIAWEIENNEAVISLMHEYGIKGLEIAPAKINPQLGNITEQQLTDYKSYWRQNKIDLYAMQALLYGAPYMAVFEGEELRNNMLAYLKNVISIAEKLGIVRLVFGSPKNRIKGKMSQQHAFDIAVPFFRQLGQISYQMGIIFCIEPNPSYYGCDFITNSIQAIELVKEVNEPGFGLHLDAAAMTLSGENITDCIARASAYIRHFHISEKDLATIGVGSVNHEIVAKALRDYGYNGWLSIEMCSSEASIFNIKSALEYVKRFYL